MTDAEVIRAYQRQVKELQEELDSMRESSDTLTSELARFMTRIADLTEDFSDETMPEGYELSPYGGQWRWLGCSDSGYLWPTRGMAAADARRRARLLAEGSATPGAPPRPWNVDQIKAWYGRHGARIPRVYPSQVFTAAQEKRIVEILAVAIESEVQAWGPHEHEVNTVIGCLHRIAQILRKRL